VVEAKSHVREESIDQLRNILERFRRFFPEHQDPRERILKAGFYVARVHGQIFELDVPANFRPKAY
jgi:hypothetical protein